MDILKGRDLAEVPWKNGGGITRNIARGMCGGRVAWTLSRADVRDDGPFSNFNGLRRILTVVSGGPMDLEHEGGTLHAAPGAPVAFDGGLPVTSRLADGPITDLNLMFDHELCIGEVTPHHGPGEVAIRPGPGERRIIHVMNGVPRVDGQPLATADTVFAGAEATLTLAEGDAVLDITIGQAAQSAAITLVIASL